MQKTIKTSLIALCCGVVFTPQGMAQRKLTIDQLFTLVDEGNSQLRSQRTGIVAAEEGLKAAKSQRLPDVSTELSARYIGNITMMDRNFTNGQNFSSPHLGNSFALEAQQTVYAGGAIDAGVGMAETGLRLKQTGMQLAKNQLCFVALGEYLDIFKLTNSIKVYEENIKLTQRLIDDIKAKQQQGMALKNDVTRYELQMENLKLGKRKLEDRRSVVNHQLCVLLGINDEVIEADGSKFQVSSFKLQEGSESFWQQEAQSSSPEITQADLSTQLAQQKLKMAKSEALPKISVFAQDNLFGPFTYDIPPIDKNFNTWGFGVGVKYPISGLWKSNKKIRQAKRTVEETQQQKKTTVESLNTRMQEAYTLYEQSFVDHRTQQKSVELANQNYNVVNERYLNQLDLITDMLDASNMKLNAELQEVNARVNIVYAYYKLKFVAGKL